MGGDGPVDVAAVDSSGALHIYVRYSGGETAHWDEAPGIDPLPPVITSGGQVLVAYSDLSAPATVQWLWRCRVTSVMPWTGFQIDRMRIDSPPFTALSLGGFAAASDWSW
jgi:hypothetical protein